MMAYCMYEVDDIDKKLDSAKGRCERNGNRSVIS
jgi:hypothetical protein